MATPRMPGLGVTKAVDCAMVARSEITNLAAVRNANRVSDALRPLTLLIAT